MNLEILKCFFSEVKSWFREVVFLVYIKLEFINFLYLF